MFATALKDSPVESGPQRRAHPRHVVAARGTITFPGRPPVQVRTTDLSFGGAGFSHDDPLPPLGSDGTLAVACYHAGQFLSMAVPARLRYTRLAQMVLHSGVEFIAPGAEELRMLQKMLAARPLLPNIRDGAPSSLPVRLGL